LRRTVNAISRIVAVIIIVILIIVAGGAYAVLGNSKSTTTSSTAQSTSSVSSSSSQSSSSASLSSPSSSSSSASSSTSVASTSSSQSSTSSNSQSSTSVSQSSTTGSAPATLVIDDYAWPIDDLNQLYNIFEVPYPNWLTDTVYQPLVNANLTREYQDGSVQYTPVLAQNWTVSTDARTYTFNLRPDVKFSNGDPMNAYQIWMEMYGFYYLSGNSSTWMISYFVFDMSTANFGPATIALINQSGLINPSQQALAIMQNSSWPIYATGPDTIVFHLKAPFSYFPGVLCCFTGLIFDTQWVLDNGGFGTPATFNSYFNQHDIPGTGPYMVTSVSENSYVQFQQNPLYWGRNLTTQQVAQNPVLDPGHVKNVIINAKVDDLARYADLSSGTAQIAAIGSSNWNQILASPSTYSYLHLNPIGLDHSALAFNTNLYPTNITDFRLALVHAINITDISQKAFQASSTPEVGPEAPLFSDYYNLGNFTPYSYNLTLAKQYLAKSNVTNVPTLTFTAIAGCTWCVTEAEVVQGDLAQIGITVNIQVSQASTYESVYGSYSTNVAHASGIGQITQLGGYGFWTLAALTPADDWNSFVSNMSGWGNWAGYSRPAVQACVNAFTSSSNTSYIQSLCKMAQTRIYNDAPYDWVGILNLWLPDGSLVWKHGVVSNFYTDCLMNGDNTSPLFNTVTFG
jgi:peptide/nickel transport system substrate-binding protein